tara:strand:+ start:553 stop:768 length:216 start_codon:yes stop_codon:yes gene_type:complete
VLLDLRLVDGLLAVVLDHITLKVVDLADLMLEVEILRFHHPQQLLRLVKPTLAAVAGVEMALLITNQVVPE